MANIQAQVYVSGHVQGVAFRYSAIRAAESLGVTGWVKNLWDGRVELLIEGTEAQVQQMVEWCQHGPRGARVTEIETEFYPYTGEFADFDVIF